jgi:hypothetical protein
MAKFIRTPFATSGDVQAIDDAAQPNGVVSFTQGYGSLYEADKTVNPNARNIERDKFNYLMNLVTAAIREFQTQSVANYISSSDNGGSNYSYAKYATVFYNSSVYVSLKDNNIDLPTVTASWSKVDLDSYLISSNNLSDLTSIATARSNLGLGTAAVMNHQEILPVGVPIPWPTTTVPVGWLQCNGQSFSATRSPLLAQAYPSLILPDLRGEFIRGWSDIRTVDVGRLLLSFQPDLIKRHSHLTYRAINSQLGQDFDSFMAWNNTVGTKFESSDAGTETDAWAGSETRPRNIAFNYIVREL